MVRPILSVTAVCTLCTFLAWGKPIHLSRVLETVWQVEASSDRKELADSTRIQRSSRRTTARLASPLAVVQLSGLNASGVVATSSPALPSGSNFADVAGPDICVDGTTQTVNVGNTNSVALGTGGTVGVQDSALVQLNGPEVQVRGPRGGAGVSFRATATNATMRGISVYGFQNNVYTYRGNQGLLLEGNVLSTSATSFTDVGAGVRTAANNMLLVESTNGVVRQNLIGFAGAAGISFAGSGGGYIVRNNEIRGNGQESMYNGVTIPLSSLTPAQQAALTAPGARLTATATLAGSTSEFSGNVVVSALLTGIVYEDVNYGGGAGRSLAASGGAPQASATVELYTNAGALAASTVTDANGRYEFSTAAGTYTVRVVSNTVRSSRPGYVAGLLPVPTFINGDENRVGGEAPQLADAPANTGRQTLAALTTATTTAQALAAVTLSASGASGVDFGFNFDVIVNPNNAGQGSLRQFLLNSNALGGEASLAQAGRYATQTDLAVGATPATVALPAGRETSIFMISNGQARPGLRAGLVNQLSGQGVAVIVPQSYLGDIVGAGTAVNGLTQTCNVGNTNDVLLGTGGTVGVDNLPLSRLNGPEVRIQGASSIAGGLRFYNAPNVEVSGLNVYGFGGSSSNRNSAAVYFNACPNARVSQNVLAPSASSFGTDPGSGFRAGTDHVGIVNLSGIVVTNNLIGFAEGLGISLFSNVIGATINNNEVADNGKDASVRWHDNVGVEAGTEITMTGNRLAGAGGRSIDIYAGPYTNCLIDNNTIEGNGLYQSETAGISLRVQGGWTIFRNVIRNNVGAGVQISATGSAIRISQNSLYGNGQAAGRESGQIGIDLHLFGQNQLQGQIPYVTYNDDGDLDSGGNNGLNYPVLEMATISGGVLTLTGFATQGAQVEVYVAQANTLATNSQAGNNFGQGKTYLLTQTEGSGQDLDGTSGSYGQSGALVNGIFQGTETSQRRFRFQVPMSSLTAAQQAELTLGSRLTATATVGSNTSEFSGNVVVGVPLTGLVFEDVNYGGGAGRGRAAGSGIPRPGARVELYDNAGAFVTATTTNANGRYEFSVPVGTHDVRVVSSSVSSSRPGYVAGLLPVPTFNGSTDRVGGEAPEKADAAANTSNQPLGSLNTATTAAQALATVTVGPTGDSGADFGFNFDVITNTNDAGQGSLRQFILNSNALGNVGLAQENGLPAGVETSIFMVPDGQAVPGLRPGLASGLLNGVAVITPATDLPAVADANTAIDGRTQTSNVGNTNAVVLGTGGTVGASATPLSQVPGPEVGIVGSTGRIVGLAITGNGARVSGLAIYGFGNGMDDNAFANIRVGAPNALITQNVLGTGAISFTDPGAGRTNATNLYVSTGPTVVSNNLIGYAHGQGVKIESRSEPVQIENNEISFNGINFQFLNGVYTQGAAVSVTGNLLEGNWGHGVDLADGLSGTLVTNNTMTGNGRGGVATAGVAVTGTGNTVSNNRIFGNYGAGILVTSSASSSLLSRNAIYGNGEVVPAGGNSSGQIGIDLLTASDNPRAGTAPYVTLNDAGDTDTGGNGLLNFPVLESASVVGGNLEVRGFARAGSAVELFLAAVHPSKFGEGQTYLGTGVEGSAQDADGSTGSYGPAAVNGLRQGQDNTNRFRFSLPINSLTASQQAALVACGAQLTATATLGGATSEFSGVVPLAPLPLAIRVTGDVPLCAGSTVRLSASPRPGFLYTWYNGPTVVNGSGAVPDDSVFVASAAGTYTVQVTQANCAIASTTSAPVSITVLPAVVAGTVGTGQTLCAGASPAPLTNLAAASGGTGTYDYQWQASTDNATWTNVSGATSATYVPGPVSATTYFRRQAISGPCEPVYTTVVALTVLPTLTAGSISADQTVCSGAMPASLTSSASVGGGTGTYTYQWEESADNTTWTVIAGATDQAYAPGPGPVTVTTYFRRRVTSGTGSCATGTSNVVTLLVLPTLTAGSIEAEQAICAGATPAPLTSTAEATGGTGGYDYQWEISTDNVTWTAIPGATSAGYAPGAVTASTYYRRRVTSGIGACATARTAAVRISIVPALLPGRVGGSQTVCAGTAPATFTSQDDATGGTGTYAYQWQISTNNVTWAAIASATGAAYTAGPVSVTTHFRRQVVSGTGTCATATSNTVTVTVNVLPGVRAGSIGTDQTLCANSTPAAFTSLASAGGGTGTYTYQWEWSADNITWTVIAGATDQAYTPGPVSVTTYFRRQATSGTGTCATATSNVVTLTVTPSPTAGVALATPPAQCAGSTLTFTPTPTNGGAAPTFRWFVNNVPAATGATFTSATLANNDQVRVQMTPTPGICATGTPTATVTVTRTPVIAPTLSIRAATSGPACEGTPLSFSIASVTGAGAAPQYQWLLNGTAVPGGTGATFSSAALRNGDRLRLRLRSSETCASPAEVLSNEVTIDLRPNTVPQVAIAGSGATCAGQPVRFAISSSGNLGATPSYQWQVDGNDVGGAQSATFSSATLRDGQAVTLTVRTTTACGQPTVVTSNQVRAIVTPPAEVSAGPDKEIMEGEGVVLEGAINGSLPVEWSPAQTLSFAGGNPLRPVASPKVTTVYTIKVNANGCEAEDKVTVKVGTAIQIPNAFSPNGDGINDAWEIDRIGTFADNTVTIFNRWGTKVYSTTGYGPANMWRGTINGEAAPIGTYYYVIKLGNGKTFTGPLTIVY